MSEKEKEIVKAERERENKVLKSKIIEIENKNDERTWILLYIVVKVERERENKVMKSKIIELENKNDERNLILLYILVKVERERENKVLKSKIIELENKNEKFITDSRQLWEEYILFIESNLF